MKCKSIVCDGKIVVSRWNDPSLDYQFHNHPSAICIFLFFSFKVEQMCVFVQYCVQSLFFINYFYSLPLFSNTIRLPYV